MILNLQELLLEKEIQGIKFNLYGKMVLLTLVTIGSFFVAYSLRELWTVVTFSILLFVILYLFSKLLQRKKYISLVGLVCVFLDLAIISVLPLIWYGSIGTESPMPKAYLVKTYIHFLIAGTLVMNAFSLQPIYPLIYAFGVVISQAGLLFYAQQDPKILPSANFKELVLGDPILLNNYILSMGIIGTLGFFLAYLTFRVRRTVVQAVQNELKLQRLSGHFSPHTLGEALTTSDSLIPTVGKEIKVAVLYCDIVGFTQISELAGAERTMELLSAYHSIVLEKAFEFKGTLDHFVGDGIYVTFGTPFTTGADAENALMCAVSILDKLAEFNLNRESDGEKGLNLRFGLHYGSVLFGNTGSEDSLEFTVIGDAISGASRLETYAKDLKKTLLASKELISEIQNIASLPIKMSSVGNLPSKNKSKPIEVFSIEKKP